MWKLMIADDEPRIRNGLRKAIPWEGKGIEVVAEAENGEEALAMALSIHPDLLFVDINMPFLNGLELIDRLKKELPDCIVIVISGHDEFAYAQSAVRLGVFDYLLKPVQTDELSHVADKAVEALLKDRNDRKYAKWINHKLDGNSLLKEVFMKNWISGKLPAAQFEEEKHFFQLRFEGTLGLMIAKPLWKITVNVPNKIWDPNLLEFAIKNILGELLQDWHPAIVFSMGKGVAAAVTEISDISRWVLFLPEFERAVSEYLGVGVLVGQATVEKEEAVPAQFQELLSELNQASVLTPVVLSAKKYLENFYYKEALSLAEVADNINVDPGYLSKLLKKELGKSFIDFLTDVRIKKAMQYLSDPGSKVYEIAEKVGYNTQHYFSHTFKKVTGISPLEYRKRGDVYEG